MTYKTKALCFLREKQNHLKTINIASEILVNIDREIIECIYKIEKYTVNDNDIKEELVRHKFMYDFNNWEKQNNG